MTTQTLERAKEIQIDIDSLRSALSEIAKGKLFAIDDRGCGFISGKQADPFLAQLDIDVKAMATTRVLEKVKELEDEFARL